MQRRSKTDLLFEKIPPALTWSLIFLPLIGSFFFPEIIAVIVIIVNIYFLYRSFTYAVFFLISYSKVQANSQVDFLSRIKELSDIDGAVAKLLHTRKEIKASGFDAEKANLKYKYSWPMWMKRIAFKRERDKAVSFVDQEIKRLQKVKVNGLNAKFEDIRHVIIIPHWKEPLNVLKDTLENIKKANFPNKQICVVLGAEARDPEGYQKSMLLKKEYEQYLGHIWVSNHVLQDNEIIGKSSNMAWAGKHAKAEIEKLGWDFKNVIITSCDADSLIPSNYFAYVTYEYLTIKDHIYKYFNGPIVFYSNIWNLPFYARVKNSMSSLYNIARMVRTDKLTPFSTYSVSFWLIDQIGYWTPWVTPEDYHLFFKGLFAFPRKVSTVPIYLLIYSDAAEGNGHMDTIKNTYFQERRWSWGISDDGWVIRRTLQLLKQGKLTLWVFYRSCRVIFDHVSGLSMSLIVLIGGNLPVLINQQFANTVVGDNIPRFSELIVRFTFIFLLILIMYDTFIIKPAKPLKKGQSIVWAKILQIAEWVVLPYVGVVLVFIPGIEAHTRLLFGKHLEYYLTKKQ